MSHYDPTDLRSQERERDEHLAQQRVLQDAENADFRWLMSSKQGRRMVWRWLERSGVFQLSFHQNALQMAFNEGNRNNGNRMLADVHTLCPQLYSVMVRENTKEKIGDGNGEQHKH